MLLVLLFGVGSEAVAGGGSCGKSLWKSVVQAMAKVFHTPTKSDGRSDRHPLKEQLSPEPLGRKTPRSKTPKRPVFFHNPSSFIHTAEPSRIFGDL